MRLSTVLVQGAVVLLGLSTSAVAAPRSIWDQPWHHPPGHNYDDCIRDMWYNVCREKNTSIKECFKNSAQICREKPRDSYLPPRDLKNPCNGLDWWMCEMFKIFTGPHKCNCHMRVKRHASPAVMNRTDTDPVPVQTGIEYVPRTPSVARRKENNLQSAAITKCSGFDQSLCHFFRTFFHRVKCGCPE